MKVVEFPVTDLDTDVEAAFKKRLIRSLDGDYDGMDAVNIVTAYLMWVHRDETE